MKKELIPDCLDYFFHNSKNLKKIKFIVEKCYRRYDSLTHTYLIKNRFNAISRLKKYPRVIVIDRSSDEWWSVAEE